MSVMLNGALAQSDNRALTSGSPVQGTLDSSAIIQTYTINGSADQALIIEVGNDLGVPLAVTLTSATGELVAQAVDIDTDGAGALSAKLPATGTFYVTVFKAAGVSSISTVDFTLVATLDIIAVAAPTLAPAAEATETVASPEVTEPAATIQVNPTDTSVNVFASNQILTQSGMTISLQWNSIDDLDLEVRDPIGGSLYWERPTVASGGALSPNINQQCVVTTPESPTETATWSPGGIPTGSYELLVYYQQSCTGDQPATFTLSVNVNGVALDEVQGTLGTGEVFVASYEVNQDGTVGLTGLSGIVSNFLPDNVDTILGNATPIELPTSLAGLLVNEASYNAYSFAGRTNDSVSISLESTTGSLDTFLFLLDPSGNVLQSNDDADIGVTNSLISGALLPVDGTYTIVATRYGKRIGGTEGNYNLTITSQVLNLPEAFLNLPRGSLELRLLWNNAADLQLLVRDSAGNAVFDDVPEIRSGGRLAAQGNVNCRVSVETPFSYIYWPTEIPPRPGVYEVEVWYQSACNDTTPVAFSLFGNYNGQQIFSDAERPLEGERYLTSFTINADGTAEPSDGGIIRGASDLNYAGELGTAVTLAAGEARSGVVTQDNKFDVYTFTGNAGDVVNIAMNNTSGTLDPLLYVLDAAGNLIAENDDAVAGENTNAFIANLALPADAQYIIIATHFGGRYGGTTGTYTLNLTRLN